MYRSLALCVVALAVCGCKNSATPGPDPFFGHTTVPPPPTGAAAVRQPGPGYAGAPMPGTAGPMYATPNNLGGAPYGPTAPAAGWPAAAQPGAALPPANYAWGSATPPSMAGPTNVAPPSGSYPAMPGTGWGNPTGPVTQPVSQPPAWTTPAPTTPSNVAPSGTNPFGNFYRGTSTAAPADGNAFRGAPAAAPYGANAGSQPLNLNAGATSNAVRIVETPTPARPLGTFAGASTERPLVPATPSDPASVVQGRQPIVRPLEARPLGPYANSQNTALRSPAATPVAAPASNGAPRSTPPVRSVNIRDLPDAAATQPASGSGSQAGDSRWTAVGGNATSAPATPVQNVSYTAEAPYGYDTNYQWLRGQLEYAAELRSWRINYIPRYGAPDRHGGSLTIANPQLLTGLQQGDLVEVRGRPAQTWSRGEMTAVYQVTEARRIGSQ